MPVLEDPPSAASPPPTLGARLSRFLLGGPRNIHDPTVFHRISLVAMLAWVGLGADGLSSSCYGPEEGFRALGAHTYLAIPLALATALTVAIISYSYSRIIEHFPAGGGGYVVASKLLGNGAGLVSGCALLVDYVLTIAISIASGGDAVFSFLPLGWQPLKFWVEVAAVLVLIVLNLRGVKESVQLLLPVFMVFVVTHVLIILGTTIYEKFEQGGWMTLVMTGGLVGLCCLIRWHYDRVGRAFRVLGETLLKIPLHSQRPLPLFDPKKPTAVLLVSGFGGLGVHSLLSICRLFPEHFHNVHFITVGVLDSGSFKGREEVQNLERKCQRDLTQYVKLANDLGFPASSSWALGTDVPALVESMCLAVAKKCRHVIVFAGKLVFEQERWWDRLLHNETAMEVQRRLQWAGQPTVVLPIRVLEATMSRREAK